MLQRLCEAKRCRWRKRSDGQRTKGPLRLGRVRSETRSKIAVQDRRPAQVKEAMTRLESADLYKGGAAANNVPKNDEQERDQMVRS